MPPEHEAHAASVAGTEPRPLLGAGIAEGVRDDEGRLVLDSHASSERPDEEVDVLARRPGSAGPEPQVLVEGPDACEDVPPNEHRGGVSRVPHIGEAHAPGRVPARRHASVCGGGTPCQEAEVGSLREGARDPLEQVVGIGAVVVRKCDQITREPGEGGVAGP